jgi:hypothetical protein
MHEDKEDDEIAKRKKDKKGRTKKEEKKKVPNSVVKNYAPVPASSRRHLFAVPISVLWAGLQKSK